MDAKFIQNDIRGGMAAQTWIELDHGRKLQIYTTKTFHGLKTTVNGGKFEGPFFISLSSDDFYTATPPVKCRATKAAIERQHAGVLDQIEEIKAAAINFYAEKTLVA